MIFQSPGHILFTLNIAWWGIILLLIAAAACWVYMNRSWKLEPWSTGWWTVNGIMLGLFALTVGQRAKYVMQTWGQYAAAPMEALTTWSVSWPIRWYGAIIALGFVVASYFVIQKAKRWQLDVEEVTNLALIGFLGGIIGGRLYFVMLNWSSFWAQPSEIIAMWHGGMSIHGGIIGGFLTTVLYCRYAKLPVLRCLDLGACGLPIAQAIGRWGNFFNSEAFGRPVPDDFPLKLRITENVPPEYFTHQFFHPTFLYECAWNLSIFAFLYYFASKKLYRYPGLAFLLYLDLYSLGRLMIEPLRVDSIMAGALPVPIIASAATMVISSALALGLIWYYKKNPAKMSPPLAPLPTAPLSESEKAT
ncbi:MAG: prolipoprotein diacylglyceryl transferase [Candidatus Melainabacteria bacterium]|nr:prolipoprotein diacylglyceryl transferase [Candidatus Melainabacteria bacterium]